MIDKVLNKGIDVAAGQLERAKDVAIALHKRVPARFWIATGALIGAIVAGCIAGYLQRDFGQRNLEYQPWPDMSISRAAESQMLFEDSDGNSPLPRHATDLAPPEGTVYRGQRFYDLKATQYDEAKARTSPYAGATGKDRDAYLARGKEVFHWVCQSCHGFDGVGSAPVTQFGVPAPKIADKTVHDKYTDGDIFHIITFGSKNGNMAPHAVHVKLDDRWKVILYLRKLQEGAK